MRSNKNQMHFLSQRKLFWLIFLGAVCLRLMLFSGYGLGDDPNYLGSFHKLYRTPFPIESSDPYQHRYGIWVPTVLSMKLFGVTEAGFIGAITLSSLILVLLCYALAKQEWGPRWGLVAMSIFAVYPLDVLCSTLFANDEILSAYGFAALWLFRSASMNEPSKRRVQVLKSTLSGVLLFFGFLCKPWVSIFVPIFLVEIIIRKRSSFVPALVSGGVALGLTSCYLLLQYHLYGDPLYHITISKKYAYFEPYSKDIWLAYPRMLFNINEMGSRFAGYFPHLLLALSLLFLPKCLKFGKWLMYTVFIYIILTGIPSHTVDGKVVVLVPLIFRYLAELSLPICMALTASLRQVHQRFPRMGVCLCLFIYIDGIAESAWLTNPTRDTFGEQRAANKFLLHYPDSTVYSDYGFNSRHGWFTFRDKVPFQSVVSVDMSSKNSKEDLLRIEKGLVVVGGARLPWYGCQACALTLKENEIPNSWTKVASFVKSPLTSYRLTPLEIWQVQRRDISH